MGERAFIEGPCGLYFDDEMEDGWIRVGPYENWYMTEDQWLYLQELEVMSEVALFLDLLGVGLHRLPDDYALRR